MPEKILSTEPPDVHPDDFEDYIATDDLFVDYFNEFLALPSFPEPLRFNSESGGFEVLTSAKHDIAQQIKLAARNKKISEYTRKEWLAEHARNALKRDDIGENDEIKTSFVVKCLDKEQGMQWIKEERLNLFLQSELYMEYRLAKLLSQVETSPTGMKLTIDRDFRPWYRSRKVASLPPPVDETAEMIQRMFVTVGNTHNNQIETWAYNTKKAEVDATSITTSRPLTSFSSRNGAWQNLHDSVRPESARGTRSGDIGSTKQDFLIDDFTWEELVTKKSKAKKVTLIAPSEVYPRDDDQPSVPISEDSSACIADHSLSKIAKLVPDFSDSESDRGMGSDSESSRDESVVESKSNVTGTQSKEYALELRSLEDYASVIVALAIKNSALSLDESCDPETLDDIPVYKNLIPQPQSWVLGLRDAKAPLPISKLNERVFAEAIMEQERRMLQETSRASRKSQKTKSSNFFGNDLLDLLPGEGKGNLEKSDMLTSDNRSVGFSESSEEDSVFSEYSDDFYSSSDNKNRIFDFIDKRGFSNFLKFISGTIGENLVQLWLDIDKIRFALTSQAKQRLLQDMRNKYLGVNSSKKIKKEILSKWNLENASKWELSQLLTIQQSLVEPILLYWGPQFLVREGTKLVEPLIERQTPLLSRRTNPLTIRPFSSQSYPCPKTITIRPLRPKSCLPRLKMKQLTDDNMSELSSLHSSHVMPPFQQLKYHPKYKHNMFQEFKHKPKLLSDNMLKALARNEEAVRQKTMQERPMSKYLSSLLNKGKRAASAGPLTQGNAAIFQQRRARVSSAMTTTRSLPARLSYRSRPVANGSVSSMTSESSTGSRLTIRGSDAMESMLQALYHDTKAGWYFSIFCERSGKVEWKNAVNFWFEVQEYHRKFYCKVFNEFGVKRSAKVIFARYIVRGAPEPIGVSNSVCDTIHKGLDPPFDELFDPAEEYILKLLIVPWNEMLNNDKEHYKKVELIEHNRILQLGSKYSSILQKKREFQKIPVVVESEVEASYKYEEDLWEKVPEEYRGFTFDELVRNRIELEHFRKFLEENYAKTDILCWLDIQAFIRLPHHANEKRDEKAKEIKSKYLHKKYFFGPSSPATKEEQNAVVKAAGGWGMTLKERPPTEMIIEAQKYVRNRLENRWLPRFLATTAFQARQRPQSNMAEVAEDVVLQRRKKRGEPWRHLDNRWQSSSDEIREFRKALLNRVTASQFRKYVSLKGDLLENDVLFWTEVQKYKDFCHIHNEPSAIEVKITAIINCFINSQVPPTVQIDIPQECAEKIMEKRRELGPYVFREAQLTVFRVLFPYWSDFCKFRENISDEKLSTILERRAQRRMVQVKKQLNQMHLEELAKEEALQQEEASNIVPSHDYVSQRDSEDMAESVVSMTPTGNMVKWSYGKYIEGIDRERMLLMMENEVKGRIPLEALPPNDPNVSSDESENHSSDEEVSSTSSHSYLGKKRKKKNKEKIIISKYGMNKTSNENGKEANEAALSNKTGKSQNSRNKNLKDEIPVEQRDSDKTTPIVTID